MWVLVPQPGIEPTYPTLESRFLTTGTPGRYQVFFFFFNYLWNHSFHFWNIMLSILEKVGVEKHFGGLLSWFSWELYFAASMWELTLAWRLGRHLSLRGTTLPEATLCSLQSSLLWPLSNCIISFTGFPARIQKYLKLSGSLAFHFLPFPKQKKQTRQTPCFFLFLYQTVELPSTQCSPLVLPQVLPGLSQSCSFGLFLLAPVFTRFVHLPLCFSSGVTPAGNVPGIPQPK